MSALGICSRQAAWAAALEAPPVVFGAVEAAVPRVGVLYFAGAWSFASVSSLDQDQGQRPLCAALKHRSPPPVKCVKNTHFTYIFATNMILSRLPILRWSGGADCRLQHHQNTLWAKLYTSIPFPILLRQRRKKNTAVTVNTIDKCIMNVL